jgi:hypothetical protein
LLVKEETISLFSLHHVPHYAGMSGYRFDVKSFIRALGGPTRCWRRLLAMGVEVKQSTLDKWVERDNMDAVYIANLLAHEALHGDGPPDIFPFIVPVEGDEGPRLVRRPRPAREQSA